MAEKRTESTVSKRNKIIVGGALLAILIAAGIFLPGHKEAEPEIVIQEETDADAVDSDDNAVYSQNSVIDKQSDPNEKIDESDSNLEVFKTLTRKVIREDNRFAGNAYWLLNDVNDPDNENAITTNCANYMPLLKHAIEKGALFTYVDVVQDTWVYSFELADSTDVRYSFYDSYPAPNFTFQEMVPSVYVDKGGKSSYFEGKNAREYINKNICVPLNDKLDKLREKGVTNVNELLSGMAE